MIQKKVYIDIEAIYAGKFNPDGSKDERNRFFKDYGNWKFLVKDEYKGVKVEYQGIIGMLIIDVDIDESTKLHNVTDHRIIQLIGRECTKENLMRELDGMDEILSYHGRTKPNHKGYTGYDFGVINAQLGVVLDELPGVVSTDLELLCHKNGLYGGLKIAENDIPRVPDRKSGVNDGLEAVKILKDIGRCTDEKKIDVMWKKVKAYNIEDVVMLAAVEQDLRSIRYKQ